MFSFSMTSFSFLSENLSTVDFKDLIAEVLENKSSVSLHYFKTCIQNRRPAYIRRRFEGKEGPAAGNCNQRCRALLSNGLLVSLSLLLDLGLTTGNSAEDDGLISTAMKAPSLLLPSTTSQDRLFLTVGKPRDLISSAFKFILLKSFPGTCTCHQLNHRKCLGLYSFLHRLCISNV